MTSYPIADNSTKFFILSKELLAVINHRVSDKYIINKRLCDLNNLNYSCCIRDNDVVMLLINRLCVIIQVCDSPLIESFCRFIINLSKSGIKISERTYATCKKWILQMLEFASPDTPDIRKIILIALKNIIEIGAFNVIYQDIQSLLDESGLLRIIMMTERELQLTEINLLAINCIEAFLINSERSNGPIAYKCKKIIKELIYKIALSSLENNGCNRLHYYKITCCCLRILRHLVMSKLFDEDKSAIGEICGLIQASMFCGINGYTNFKPKYLHPALMNIPERIAPPTYGHNIQSVNKMKGKKNQAKKVTNKTVCNSSNDTYMLNKFSSDSETSDTEILSLDHASSRVRGEAINLLYTVIHEMSCRDMFGYWSQIIVNTSGARARVLVSLINNEPVSKLRQLGLNTLTEAIYSARTLLAYAEESDHTTFLTFFGTVSIMLKEIHTALALLFRSERNVAVLTHALKCVAALVNATPYSRLKPQLATELIQQCRIYILHTDPTIRVAALSIFETLSSIHKFTPELLSILAEKYEDIFLQNNSFMSTSRLVSTNNCNIDVVEIDKVDTKKFYHRKGVSNINSYEAPIDTNISFLLQICLKNISNTMVQVPVKLQSLKLLGALINDATQHLVFSHLDITTQHLLDACQEAEPQVALHSCRVIEKISSHSITNSCKKEEILVKFWDKIFSTIISFTQSLHTYLREVACDCLGTINNEVFSQFSPDKSILIITTLLGAVRDEESAVRAASLRALGMLVVLPSLEENTGFIMDLIDIVCVALQDNNLGVRIKAAWTLANVSDCLIRINNDIDMEPLPLETFLQKLYKISVKSGQDNNKVKCNVLRAVGNIIYLYKDVEAPIDVSEGLQVLIECATTGNDMKVRWNACRALGFIMSYEPDTILPPNWKDKIFPALCDLICHSPNFKVRTNAAWALAACNLYGKYVPYLWKSIVMALDNSQHVPNFVEYSHRDALVQQLCLTLGHVAARTDLSDLQTLWLEINDHVQDIVVHIKYFQERVLPEKTDDFMAAKSHMKNYMETASTPCDRKIAETLSKLFEIIN